jgi:alpha-glucosidase
MNTLVTMLPGTSVTYYGEEIGMSDSCAYFADLDHNIPALKCDSNDPNNKHSSDWVRSPMQWDGSKNGGFSSADKTWLPVNENFKTVNVKAQLGKEKSHLEIHRSLMKLRKNEAIMESDKFEIKALGENSFAFKR